MRLLLSLCLASVTLGWVVVGVALMVWAGRRIRQWELQRPGSTGLFAVTPFVYVLSLQSALASVVVGAVLLRSPGLARQGRISLFWAALFGTLQLVLSWAAALASLR